MQKWVQRIQKPYSYHATFIWLTLNKGHHLISRFPAALSWRLVHPSYDVFFFPENFMSVSYYIKVLGSDYFVFKLHLYGFLKLSHVESYVRHQSPFAHRLKKHFQKNLLIWFLPQNTWKQESKRNRGKRSAP